MKKEFGYIEFDEKTLFNYVVLPDSEKENKTLIIMCYPFGHEYLISQRVYYNLAEELSANGYTIFIFDYRGFGDSSHTFKESTPSTIMEDIKDVIQYAKKLFPEYDVGLMGMRLGGSWAVLASIAVKVDFLILWSPVVDLKAFFYNELRKSISSQTTILRKVVYNREQIIERLKNGQKLDVDGFIVNNIDGYVVNKSYFEETEFMSLLDREDLAKIPTLIVDIKTRMGPIAKAYKSFIEQVSIHCPLSYAMASVENSIPWNDGIQYNPWPENTFKMTIDWLSSYKRG